MTDSASLATAPSGLNGPHVSLIARFSVRFALRTGGGIMFLLIAVIAGLGVAAIFITPVERMLERPQFAGVGGSEIDAGTAADRILQAEEVRDVVKWITGGDDAQARYLMNDKPALLSAIVVILLMLFPFLACLGSFNQTTGDIGSRGLRYLLLRTERPNIFLGRFLGTAAFVLVCTVLLMTIVLLYVGFKLKVYSAGALVGWGLQTTLALAVLALPYAAMCAWMSGMLDTPFGSLALCLLLAGFPILFFWMLDVAIRADAGWLMKTLPWGWKYDLLSVNVGERLLAYGALLGMTGFFLWIGARAFQKRDL